MLSRGAAAEMESTIEGAGVATIAAAPGVARSASGAPAASGELIVVIVLDKLGSEPANVQIRGVPDGGSSLRPALKIVEGRAARPGSSEAIVGRAIRGRFAGLELGQHIELAHNRPIEIVGVFDDAGSAYASEIWADLELVRSTFGQTNVVSSVRVRLTSEGAFEAFRAAVEADPRLGVSALREADYADQQSQGTAGLIAGLGTVVALLLALGAVIGAMVTMHAAIGQREREIGTLRALGFSRLQILASFVIESILLALFGGAIGAAASLLMALGRVSMVNASTWSELSFGFEPTPAILLGALAVAALMGFAGGLGPALRATRVDPARVMRGA